jgi:uncharacterized protein (TIGR03032 family)
MTASGDIDVFLSYSRADATIAAELAHALEKSELSIWWDAYLIPDKPFEETVKDVLRHTEIIVGILSLSSLQSPWVRWELAQAHEQGLRVVPLLADGLLQKDLPTPLNRLHALFLDKERSPDAIEKVVDSVRRIIYAIRNDPKTENSEDRSAKFNITAEHLTEASISSASCSPDERANDERDYLCSNGFKAFLQTYNVSIAFTSFPLSRLFLIRQNSSNGKMLKTCHAPDARALHVGGGRFLVGCETYIAEMADISKTNEIIEGSNSHFFIPRIKHVTGNLDIHDIASPSFDRVLFTNTRYSCLSNVSSAEPVRNIWTPCFISELAPEDRCHLNGIAMRNGEPTYVSSIAPTDVIDGWRQHRASGGIIIDVTRNRIICRGLSMPHSPRFHGNRLWILNSGTGELGVVESGNSDERRFEPIAFIPGFLRGLVFIGPYAIVGLSRPRYEVFKGLPLHDRLHKKGLPPWSGTAVVDTRDGRCVEWFRLTGRVWEVSDVAVLPGASNPTATWDPTTTGQIISCARGTGSLL